MAGTATSGRRAGTKNCYWKRDKDLKLLWEASIPILLNALNDPTFSRAKKTEIALELVKKLTPAQEAEKGNAMIPTPVTIILDPDAGVSTNTQTDTRLALTN